MIAKSKERGGSFSSRIRAAIYAANVDVPAHREKELIDRVHDVYKHDTALKSMRATAPPAVLRNLVVLIWSYGFVAKDIRPLLKAELDADVIATIIDIRRQEITFLWQAYGWAVANFDALETALHPAKSLGDVDLSKQRPSRTRPKVEPPSSAPPLHLIRFIEDLRDSKAFQEGSPDAVCKVAEHYIDIGALSIAVGLLKQAFKDDPDHAGLWFQKARLLLALAAQEGKAAGHFELLRGEADALSAAEQHWEAMAGEHWGRATDLREQVFPTCLEAFLRLPENAQYEASARKWSASYGAMRDLRRQILVTIVREAGLRTQAGRSMDWLERGILVRREAAQVSGLLVSAYDELMGDSLLQWELRPRLRLLALNFLRPLAPERYPAEVGRFVEDLRSLGGRLACEIIGAFDGMPVASDISWRAALHEHLDAVMDRAAQREFVRGLHSDWAAWVTRMQAKTLGSLYVDEVRLLFGRGEWANAYRVACRAEDEGVFRRNDGKSAFVLWRAALAAAKASHEIGNDEGVAEIVARHLSDRKMVALAEDHYATAYEDEDHLPVGSPLDGEGLEEFAQMIGVAS